MELFYFKSVFEKYILKYLWMKSYVEFALKYKGEKWIEEMK